MKIAVIGTGIAGNVAAWHLCRDHDVTVFEANDYVGGHTHTHMVEYAGRQYAVDSGFIVFNRRTYPNFVRLLDQLDVHAQPTEMSFSVTCARTGLEYNGSSLDKLFAQRRNLLRPRFYRMIRDILRFNRDARRFMDESENLCSLGEFLARGGYGREFIEYYLIPMGAAIWSADPLSMYAFPAHFILRFFDNHGLLDLKDRPQWFVVKGGSKAYVDKLTAPFYERIRLRARVTGIRRLPTHVKVTTADGTGGRFDHVFLACHSDQALRLLQDPDENEKTVLSAIRYQRNDAILHTDDRLLPRRRHAWAAWNYHIPLDAKSAATVTYNMNSLQGLELPVTFCVTLNSREDIDPRQIITRTVYEHPVFTPEGVSAQARQGEINGVRRTYYCGAYWRYGFHEDGVVSALNALDHFKQRIRDDGQLSLQRVG